LGSFVLIEVRTNCHRKEKEETNTVLESVWALQTVEEY